eukprot:9612952-Alexandrium_andersonii.AAC.1
MGRGGGGGGKPLFSLRPRPVQKHSPTELRTGASPPKLDQQNANSQPRGRFKQCQAPLGT